MQKHSCAPRLWGFQHLDNLVSGNKEAFTHKLRENNKGESESESF